MRPLIVLLFVGMAFAGCVDDDVAAPLRFGAVDASILEEGQYVEFDHRGGDLYIGLADGDLLAVQLYDPADNRLGRLELSPETFGNHVTLEALDAGAYVLWIQQLNGTLDLRSRGMPVDTFRILASHVERVILAETSMGSDLTFGLASEVINQLAPTDPLTQAGSLNLSRVPSWAMLFFAGNTQGLDFTLRGDHGVVMHLDSTSESTYTTGGAVRLAPLSATFMGENAKAPAFDYDVRADHFEGVLVLQAESYSRYEVDNVAPSQITLDVPVFTYGELPGEPVGFNVHEGARYLYLAAKDPRPESERSVQCHTDPSGGTGCTSPVDIREFAATVAIYGPDDERLGVYYVIPNATQRIPITTGGQYVAVSDGLAVLGADRVPIDFELHVLETHEQEIGESVVGSRNDYELLYNTAQVAGVAFRIEPTMLWERRGGFPDDLLVDGCSTYGNYALVQDNETVAHWGDGASYGNPFGGLAVPQGDLMYWQDGMGGTCGQMGAAVHYYTR